jgi:lipid-A-disaccharide synthase
MSRYFISVGEASGDLHAAPLIRELRLRDHHAEISGVAGPMMRAEGINEFLRMEELQVMGFVDVIKAFPRIYRIFRQVKKEILHTNPDIVILVDYPGFHLKLAEKLRKGGFAGKIIQYISPTVWAHGKHRIEILEKYYDQLLCILPFEPKYFNPKKLEVAYVGHPLVERLAAYPYRENWKSICGIDSDKPILALFPGSRPSEIETHLPIMLEAAKDWKGQVVVSGEGEGQIPREFTYELMRDCEAAIAKSGTVTLELALHEKPTVVIYKTSLLNRWIAKYILKLEHMTYFCIVNILAQKEVFPELIREPFTAQDVAKKLFSLDKQAIVQECKAIKRQLGTLPTSKLAVVTILC